MRVDFDGPTYRIWNNDYSTIELCHHIYTWFCRGYYPAYIAQTIEKSECEVRDYIDYYEAKYKYGKDTIPAIRNKTSA